MNSKAHILPGMCFYFCAGFHFRKQRRVNALRKNKNMPKKVELKLKKEAKKKGFSKKRTGAYVYGTMKKLGLMK